MKQAYIKNKKEFNEVATQYGFTKRYVGERYEQWFKQVGRVEIYVFDRSNEIRFCDKGKCVLKSKKFAEKLIKDISHLIEWR